LSLIPTRPPRPPQLPLLKRKARDDLDSDFKVNETTLKCISRPYRTRLASRSVADDILPSLKKRKTSPRVKLASRKNTRSHDAVKEASNIEENESAGAEGQNDETWLVEALLALSRGF
jgi:hypothetical protein